MIIRDGRADERLALEELQRRASLAYEEYRRQLLDNPDVIELPRAHLEGGHVRVGLEDAPLGCRQSNVELVQQARRQIEAAGGRLASPAAIRQSQARPHA